MRVALDKNLIYTEKKISPVSLPCGCSFILLAIVLFLEILPDDVDHQ